MVEEKLAKVIDGVEEVEKKLGRKLGPKRMLTLLETAYLAYINLADIIINNNKTTFKDIIILYSRENPHAWAEFEVYIDLRQRGRIVAPGPRSNTLLVKYRKIDKNYRYYVLVLEEDIEVPLTKLKSFIEEAHKNGWEPLLAIVDRYGDITYYTPSLFRPNVLREKNGKATSKH